MDYKDYADFNIVMSDGNNDTLELSKRQENRMIKQEPVAKIVVYQHDFNSCLYGFRFYSK